MKIANTLKKIGGIFLVTIGLFLLFGCLVNISERGYETSDGPALIFLAILPISLGSWMIWKSKLSNEQIEARKMETMILQIAKKSGGKLTGMELASKSQLNLGEANNVLENIHLQGYTQIHHADNGAIIYEFPDLLSTNQKNNSERML